MFFLLEECIPEGRAYRFPCEEDVGGSRCEKDKAVRYSEVYIKDKEELPSVVHLVLGLLFERANAVFVAFELETRSSVRYSPNHLSSDVESRSCHLTLRLTAHPLNFPKKPRSILIDLTLLLPAHSPILRGEKLSLSLMGDEVEDMKSEGGIGFEMSSFSCNELAKRILGFLTTPILIFLQWLQQLMVIVMVQVADNGGRNDYQFTTPADAETLVATAAVLVRTLEMEWPVWPSTGFLEGCRHLFIWRSHRVSEMGSVKGSSFEGLSDGDEEIRRDRCIHGDVFVDQCLVF
ncbi:hypothetical protein L6452_20471 [Arctium lappa]|uniref:Uncharacterized protein n=1 Tax=Arctium lappa TaxID=4217 RepID=A0ACB9BB06_ARCLA|nr:hypothetical protein L6452_20471 [Arctium lappa]